MADYMRAAAAGLDATSATASAGDGGGAVAAEAAAKRLALGGCGGAGDSKAPARHALPKWASFSVNGKKREFVRHPLEGHCQSIIVGARLAGEVTNCPLSWRCTASARKASER